MVELLDGYRVEIDSMGEMLVPQNAYYAAQTARAIENFQISGLKFSPPFIRGLGLIKTAAAKANLKLNLLDKRRAEAIIKAATDVSEGKLNDQFVVEIFQTGSGTSTNMNANEVIANKAIEYLGGKRGDKSLIHPNDHVNMGQSTNDVFPTAIHVAAAEEVSKKLLKSLDILIDVLHRKAEEFGNVVKSGRTHLQDALPVTLGQEFEALAAAQALKGRLHGVRLDTPSSRRGDMKKIVQEVRWALNIAGHKNVKIFVSGGVDEEELRELSEIADGFGVGTSIAFPKSIDLAMDIVEIDERPVSKRGKLPGRKQVYRCPSLHDSLTPFDRDLEKCPKCNEKVQPLLKPLITDGKIVGDLPRASMIRRKVLEQLAVISGLKDYSKEPILIA